MPHHSEPRLSRDDRTESIGAKGSFTIPFIFVVNVMADEKWCVACGDGHVGAPTAVYRDYLEQRLHRQFDEFLETHKWRWSPVSEDSFFGVDFHDKFRGTEGYDPQVGTALAWDPALRLKAMDRGGIACEVLNPDDQNSNDPPFGSGLANAAVDGENYPPELVRMGARAYNRWLAEFCSADPNRLRGLVLLGTLDDVNWCVEEVYRAYEAGLTTGILLPLEYYLPLYHHPRYDILWQACVDLDLSIEVHVSKGNPNYLGEDPFTERFLWGYEAMWFAKRPLWSMIVGGILERYPTLRLVFTEMGMDWVAPLLAELDWNFAFYRGPMRASREGLKRRVDLSLKPSEYWQRQCFVTHSSNQVSKEFSGELFDQTPNMVYGSDLGHAEGIWPYAGFPGARYDHSEPIEGFIKSLLGGLPAEKMRPYLTDNFFRAYPNVERSALQRTVDRIGSTANDLGLTTRIPERP